MVDGIEGIGGYGEGRERPQGRVVPRASRKSAGGYGEERVAVSAAAFAPVADLLDEVARLACERDGVDGGGDAGQIAARMLGAADATLDAQARLDVSCVRVLLESARSAK